MDLSTASADQIMKAAARLYLEYGKGGKGLISPEGERTLERESDNFTSFVATHFSSTQAILNAALSPEVEEEHRRLVLNFYTTLVSVLPEGAA